jgi:DNA (cytosine-5)-methyltransferase 1
VENSPSLCVRGLGRILSDLAHEGYDAEWDGIPAASVGAVHLRAREWVLAYPARVGNGLQADPILAGWDRFIDRDWWAGEPGVRRVAHGVPSRVDRLRCLGNAVVPQIPEIIGRSILEAERAGGACRGSADSRKRIDCH